jgi:uncharacterized protein YgbK (DUF1537 family)
MIHNETIGKGAAMLKLLIIADDFTGALDTGVQFAAEGIETRVITNTQVDFSGIAPEAEVLVLDAETRHLSGEAAYQVVYETAKRAWGLGIPYIYKKTDSALRGNVGSELKAVLDATGSRSLHFFPAFPRMHRTTEDGIHYINGIPVHESVFGRDPFDPVKSSSVKELISETVPVTCVGNMEGWKPQPGIMIYDAGKDEELREKGEFLKAQGELGVTAGCAGFASILPKLLGLEGRKSKEILTGTRFFMVCGSVNPITRVQVEHGERCGFYRIRMTPAQKLDTDYYKTGMGRHLLEKWCGIARKHPWCILDTNDLEDTDKTMEYARTCGLSTEEVRVRISTTLGYILTEMIGMGLEGTLMIVGGDCLIGFIRHVGAQVIVPVYEAAPGAVVFRICVGEKWFNVISKSGGFGEADLLETLAGSMAGIREEIYAGQL